MQAFSVSGCVFEQQLVFIGSTVGVPPFAEQSAALFLTLHFGPLVDAKQHVTAPGLPQDECAAHFLTAPVQFFGSCIAVTRCLATPATQLT